MVSTWNDCNVPFFRRNLRPHTHRFNTRFHRIARNLTKILRFQNPLTRCLGYVIFWPSHKMSLALIAFDSRTRDLPVLPNLAQKFVGPTLIRIISFVIVVDGAYARCSCENYDISHVLWGVDPKNVKVMMMFVLQDWHLNHVCGTNQTLTIKTLHAPSYVSVSVHVLFTSHILMCKTFEFCDTCIPPVLRLCILFTPFKCHLLVVENWTWRRFS